MSKNFAICAATGVSKIVGSLPVVDLSGWRFNSPQRDSIGTSGPSKANRLAELARDPNDLGAVVTTAAEVTEATPFVSVLYIPGDLSRQADLLNACVDSGCEIWVERGAFLGVADMNHIAEKLSGARGGIVETGSAFGYGDRLLDPRAFAFARQLNLPIMLNISHVAQPPGAPYPWATGWQRNLTVELFLECGIAMGATGFVCDAALHPDLAHGGLLATQARALQSLRGRIGETHRHE